MAFDDGVDHTRPLVLGGNIVVQELTRCTQTLRGGISFRIEHISDHDVGPSIDEQLSFGSTLAPSTARDESNLVVESIHVMCLPFLRPRTAVCALLSIHPPHGPCPI